MWLRKIEECDLETLRSLRNDPYIYKWCRQFEPISKTEQLKWFEKINSDPTIKMFTICDRMPPIVIGACGLTSIDLINRRAEFSCYVGRSFQRAGIGLIALRTLFEYGFNVLGLNVIWGEVFDGNPALRLFQNRLGMKHEGIRRQFYFRDGNWLDAHLISITRMEFLYGNTSNFASLDLRSPGCDNHNGSDEK